MTRKIISALLVLIMIASAVVPAYASSSETLIKLEDKSRSNDYYDTFGAVYDASTNKSVKFDYTVPENGATVLLFYSTATSNNGSTTLFSELSSAKWANSSKINFVAIESSKDSAANASAYIAKNDRSGFVDKAFYDKDDQHLLMWYYTYIDKDGAVGGSIGYSVAFCYAVFITSENGKNYIRYSISGVQHASQISSALSKMMDTSALTDGYGGYLDSGSSVTGKLPKAEITKILKENPIKIPLNDSAYFSVQPTVSGSYKTGAVNTEYLQAATDRLSALRRIAGLPAVTMDESLNTQAQYGAVLLAASDFGHYPKQPADMKDDFFEMGIAATSSSNISAGRQLVSTPDGFMEDPGTNNLPVMGHRRWQLNPYMAKVGFGFAINGNNTNGYKYYTDEMAHDSSGEGFDYRFIGWPASGNFPNQLFAKDTAWSVTLCPAYYQTPDIDRVSVALKRESDGKKWEFSNDHIYVIADSGSYFTVETNNYAVPNCIIFRPDGIDEYEGTYTVVIDGLRDSFGNPVSLSYKVNFFDANDYLVAKAGWISDNGYWYYYDNGLNMAVGWKKISGKWYYFNSSGQMQKGWQKIGKKWYYFDKSGAMLSGWQKISKKWYYFDASGAMLTGWQKISKKWYYFDASGAMLTGWQKISKKWYYFDASGTMLTGWQKISKKWYYFNSSGIMTTGWLKLGGKWYYFNSSGVMATGSVKIGKKTYKFNSSGVCLNP